MSLWESLDKKLHRFVVPSRTDKNKSTFEKSSPASATLWTNRRAGIPAKATTNVWKQRCFFSELGEYIKRDENLASLRELSGVVGHLLLLFRHQGELQPLCCLCSCRSHTHSCEATIFCLHVFFPLLLEN